MAVSAGLVYWLSSSILGGGYINNLISTFIALCVSAVIYIAVVLCMHIMNKDDILLLPKGEKVYNLLTKFKIYEG